MKVGQKIKEAIDWSPYKQTDVAKMLGISQGMVSNYISGSNSISLDKLEKIADFLGVSLWTLLNGEPLPVTPLDITEREATVIAEYRRLSPDQQDKLYDLMKTMR